MRLSPEVHGGSVVVVICFVLIAVCLPDHVVVAFTTVPPTAVSRGGLPTRCSSRIAALPCARSLSQNSDPLNTNRHHANRQLQMSMSVTKLIRSGLHQFQHVQSSSSTAVAATSAVGSNDPESSSSTGKTSQPQLTIAAASLNLIKAIVGSAVLALPSGIAAVSDFPRALIPASILLLVLGSFSAYTFGLYGRICHTHQAKTLGEAWEKEFGSSPWLLSLGLCLFCGGAALTYNIVVGDTFSSLATSLGMTGWLASRHASILLVSLTTLLPLCSLPSLAALAPVSMLGVIGVLVTTMFMGWRCLAPTSPYRLASGVAKAAAAARGGSTFLRSLSPQLSPSFSSYSKIVSPSALILAAMAATSFTGHFSAPDFYHSLRDASNDNGSEGLRKYHAVTAISFASVALINVLILAFGFLTFGGHSAGMILNNYSTLDKGASLCRFLMAISVIGGYPFLISACKTALLEVIDQFNKNKKNTQGSDDKGDSATTGNRRRLDTLVTRALVATFTGLALILPNAGFVVSFNGALLGSVFCYVLPAILFLSNTSSSSSVSRRIQLERWLSRGLVVIGSVAGVAGGAVSILNAYFPHVLR